MPVGSGAAPLFSADLWPHRSLGRPGFRVMLLAASLGLAIPLFALARGGAFWVAGGFCLLALALLWGLVSLTYRSGRVRETVCVWPDRLRIERIEPNGARLCWEANPHWVRVRLVDTSRIEDYLMLSSSGREVELGAFLTPDERRSLARELKQALRRAEEHYRPR